MYEDKDFHNLVFVGRDASGKSGMQLNMVPEMLTDRNIKVMLQEMIRTMELI